MPDCPGSVARSGREALGELRGYQRAANREPRAQQLFDGAYALGNKE